MPGIGVGGRAVRQQDVAEHPARSGWVVADRHELERRRIRLGQHVRLIDAGEPLDRRAVEADALGERAFQLGRSHGDGLQVAEHIGEPQPDEPDITLFERAQHKLFLPVHRHSLPGVCFLLVTGPAD